MHTINSVFKAQQAYKYTLRTSNATQRINKLKGLKSCIEKYEEEIYAALQQDLRKCTFEAALTELIFIYSEIDFAIKNLAGWMKPRRVGKTISNIFAKNRIYYEPKGVCLIIAPWNYPFQLSIGPLISAIAAGNCAILKPSELSSETSSIISTIIEEVFSEEEAYCFEGDASVSARLLTLPFDHVFFTGSPSIGKIVMEAAAKNLTSVTLELGGKSPVLVDASANLKRAAEKIAWGKLTNSGQTCIAPDYVLIPAALEKQFVALYKGAAEKMFFDEALQPDLSVYAKIINNKHFQRLSELVTDAVNKGAILAFGGGSDAVTRTINPIVLTQLSKDANIMDEEIFGPILPVIPYENINEAIKEINEKSKPLALYIFSENKSAIRHIIANTSAGGTCVNDVLIHIANPKLPFGGVNGSGIGSAHGYYGFKTFSHERAVVFQSRIDFTRLIYPPYRNKYWILNWLKKLI